MRGARALREEGVVPADRLWLGLGVTSNKVRLKGGPEEVSRRDALGEGFLIERSGSERW